jgi:hypothetical protein
MAILVAFIVRYTNARRDLMLMVLLPFDWFGQGCAMVGDDSP